MGSIPFETVETAVARWLARSLTDDVDAGAIYWIRQGNARPPTPVAPPYITMAFTRIRRMGADGKLYTKDEDEVVTETIYGPRVCRLELQCFGLDDVKGTRAGGYLDTAITALGLDVNRSAFRAANIAVGPITEIITLPRAEDFEPRAVVELDIHVSAEVSGPAYEIKYVEMVDETMGEGPEASVFWVPEEPPEEPPETP